LFGYRFQDTTITIINHRINSRFYLTHVEQTHFLRRISGGVSWSYDLERQLNRRKKTNK